MRTGQLKEDPTLVKSLDKQLTELRNIALDMEEKRGRVFVEWLEMWTKYLRWETTFDPTKLRAYHRGEIVYLGLGFRVGNEQGGVRYAVVVENNNAPQDSMICVVPLTSLKPHQTEADVHPNDVYLGEVIPWTPGEKTVAIMNQYGYVSKLRIIKPKYSSHQVATVPGLKMDEIDAKHAKKCSKPQKN